jgi:diguanylate cyclase (GGDEF)-like protein
MIFMSKLNEQTVSQLKKDYDINLVEDILLGRNDRVLFFADTINKNNIELKRLHGQMDLLGFREDDTIELNDLFNRLDLNNKYAEVAGQKEYQAYVKQFLFVFDRESDVTFPIIIHGQRVWMRVILVPIKNHVVAYHLTNVSYLLESEEALYEKTHHDSLTQLFNKYTLDFHYGKRYIWPNFHVLYLDLDNFKIINDTYGHHAGNECLIKFSAILKKYSHDYNHFYRIGGDEFVGMFFETEDYIKEMAKNILNETKQISIERVNAKITVSIGIVKATKSEDVIRKADDLLYRVKSEGKNNFIYEIEI